MRCQSCRRVLWPWQSRAPRVVGPEHRRCYVERYERLLVDDDWRRLPERAFWDAVLVSPEHVSIELRRRWRESLT